MNRMPVAARREQLIEAALRVASRDGIDAATVRAVAAEAGVSLGVVHYCFEDKDELLRAVADAITTHNHQAADMSVPEGADLHTALRYAVTGLWEGILSNRGDQLLSYELTTTSLRHAELSQVAVAQYRGGWLAAEVFLERIEEAIGITWLVPRARLARTVIAMIDGISLAWLVDGDDAAAVTTLTDFAEFLASQAATLPPGLSDVTLDVGEDVQVDRALRGFLDGGTDAPATVGSTQVEPASSHA